MPDRCPHCGLLLLELEAVACPECGKSLTGGTGITATPPTVDGSVAEGPPPTPADLGVPDIVNPEAVGPSCPPLLLIVLSGFLCAAQGAMIHFGKPGRLMMNSDETVIGGILGALIGLGLAVDLVFFQRKLRVLTAIPADDPDAPLNLPSTGQAPSEWVPIAMLLVPILTAVITWFGKTLRLTELQLAVISSAAIVGTSLLGYLSIRQMALHAHRRRSDYHGAFTNPAFVYLGMLGFWIICYPVHFVSRWRMGGRNLILPAVIATAAYCVPMVQPFLTWGELPSVDDAEVLSLVKQMLEDEPMMKPVTLMQPIEISFDEALQKRVGRCTLDSKHGKEPVTYLIDWRDRNTGIWQVQLTDRLPWVNTPEVLDQLRLVVEDDLFQKGGRIALGAITFRNPQQVSYDPVKQKRVGRAVRNTLNGDAPIFFVVEWHDAERKLFNVKIQDRQP